VNNVIAGAIALRLGLAASALAGRVTPAGA
jgi:hypothetical protein